MPTDLERQIANKLAEHWIDEHEMAAGYHYGALVLLEDNPDERDCLAEKYGDEEWHDHWYWIHAFTAEYIRRYIKDYEVTNNG